MLPRDLLVKIFSHLGTPRDVVICSAVCRLFADAASEPELWHEVAAHKYGAVVADRTIHLYEGNWNGMVKDDNKRGALPTLTFSKPCFWLYNGNNRWQDTPFYCCIVTGIKWDRHNGKLRVYLDARGETDLRDPRGSSICMHGDDQMGSFWAESWREDEGKSGHYKGCLVFDGAIFSREEETFNFCYANLHHSTGDYESIVLLTGTLDSFGFDHYTLDSSLFESDTPEVELARWKGVAPERVLQHRRGWWV
jgi:F-box-like